MSKVKPIRTLAELAQEAINIQDACNLSGLVLGWGEALHELRTNLMSLEPCADTERINKHPINILWAAKLFDLTGGKTDHTRYYDIWSKALEECTRMAEAPDKERQEKIALGECPEDKGDGQPYVCQSYRCPVHGSRNVSLDFPERRG